MTHIIKRGLVALALIGVAGATLTATAPRAATAQSFERCADLGVMVQHIDSGFVVRSVMRGGIANELGLTRGDVVFAIDGQTPNTLDDLHRAIFSGADRAIHDLDVLRGGRHLHAAIYHIGNSVNFTNRLH